jgi:hypothetical protein
VKRSQIRRIYLREGVRWRHTHSWGDSSDPEFVPKGPRSSATTPSRPRGRRPCAPMNWGQEFPAPSLQPLPGRPMGIASKHRWTTVAAPRRPGSMEPYACVMARS